MQGAARVPVPDHWLGYKAVAAVTGHGPSHGGAGQWPSPSSPLFCKFHRALTFRHHSADTTHHLCQPAYIKDTPRDVTLAPTSVAPNQCAFYPMLSPFPCSGATDVCSYVCTASEGASWCSVLCHLSGLLGALVSPIMAYISAICGRRDRYEQLRNFPITPLLSCWPVI